MNASHLLRVNLKRYFVVTVLLLPTAAVAIPCNTGLIGTASTCGISLLSAGSSDFHWQLANPYPTAPSGALINGSVVLPTLSFSPVFANVNAGSWMLNGPDSGWVVPSASFHTEFGGQYVYQTTFTGANPFGGRYSSDNELLGVFLNNTLLPGFPLNGPADSGNWTSFIIGSGLNTGSNTLDFVVRNRGVGGIDSNSTVTGFRAEFAAVPVPAAVWLLASGLLGLIGVTRCKIT